MLVRVSRICASRAYFALFGLISGLFGHISACLGSFLAYFGLFWLTSAPLRGEMLVRVSTICAFRTYFAPFGLISGLFEPISAYLGSFLAYFDLFGLISAPQRGEMLVRVSTICAKPREDNSGLYGPISAYLGSFLAYLGLFWLISERRNVSPCIHD